MTIDPCEDLFRCGARRLPLEKLLNVFGQRLPSSLGSPNQLPVQAIRNVSHLNHLGHVLRMLAHAQHMHQSSAGIRFGSDSRMETTAPRSAVQRMCPP